MKGTGMKGNFTQVPNEILEAGDLTPSEKLLWIMVKKHDFGQPMQGIFPGRKTLALPPCGN